MIIAQMVGRNESSRYLREVLEHLSNQVDKIVFTDDCSDDNTLQIASEYAETFRTPEPLFTKHEGMLRSFAWANLEKFAKLGDWIIAIDCDEKLYHSQDMPLASVLKASPYDVVSVKFYHMWNHTQYRVDKLWAPTISSRIFRFLEDGKFANRALACGSEPLYVRDMLSKRNFWLDSGLKMQHLGYILDEDKESKFERYQKLDGGQYHNLDHINSIVDKNPVLIDWGIFGD
jgi:glycosyltransferase involved in cell wall biosynthesis